MQTTLLPALDGTRVSEAIERFEWESDMDSDEFASRFLAGEFGRDAWARAWFGLLDTPSGRRRAMVGSTWCRVPVAA